MNKSQTTKELLTAVIGFARSFLEKNLQQVVLLHHNDCDGLTSGAILQHAFERLHLKVLRYCLEKPYPLALKEIFNNPLLSPNSAFVFVDFASGMLKIIEKLNTAALPIFVIDHHQVESGWTNGRPATRQHINLLNCREFGVDGSKDCSASALAYQFALAINSDNRDLLPLGLLGAIGDGQYQGDFEFSGLNQVHQQECLARGLINQNCQFLSGHNIAAQEFVNALNALGSLAYFTKGPDIALKGLAEGFDQRYRDIASNAIDEFNSCYTKFKSALKLNDSPQLQWFMLDDNFSKFGVKTVGLICERMIAEGFSQANKILAGFQKIPDHIPGLANIKFDQYKVSLRLPSGLKARLFSQPECGLDQLLPEAIHRLGGFVDACHPHAAAATVQIGQEQELIDILNQLYPKVQ